MKMGNKNIRLLLASACLPVLFLATSITPGMAVEADSSAKSIATSFNSGHVLSKGLIAANKCKLPNTNGQTNVSIGRPIPPDRTKSKGTVNYVVLFADFPNLPSSRSTEEIGGFISPKSEREFFVDSNGQLVMKYKFLHKWLRMPKPSTEYSFATFFSHKDYISDAVQLADAEIDFSKYDGVLVMTDPDDRAFSYGPAFTAMSGLGIKADGVEIRNGATSAADLEYWGAQWANHEIGHNLGLPDLYAYSRSSDTHGFVGEFSYMGLINGEAPGLFAYEKWLLGWFKNKQIICKPKMGKAYELKSRATKTGKKLLLVPLGRSKNLAVEYRTSEGLDSGLRQAGVLTYIIDSSILSGSGPLKVVTTASGVPLSENSILRVGESISTNGYRVSFESVKSGKAKVRIYRD